jgi:hypothetical protein
MLWFQRVYFSLWTVSQCMKYGTRFLDKYIYIYIKKENVADKSYVFITGINIYHMYIFLYETFKKYIY